MINVLVCVIESLYIGKTKGKGTFGKVKQGTHDPTNEKVLSSFLINFCSSFFDVTVFLRIFAHNYDLCF